MARTQKRWSGAYRLKITWRGADIFQGPYADETTAKSQRSRILNQNKGHDVQVVVQTIPGDWVDLIV